MADGIRVERIGAGGMPEGAVAFYETASEIEAVAVATYEADAYRSGPRRVATVFDAAGLSSRPMPDPPRRRPMRRGPPMPDDERRDWALADREAKVLIGTMLAFQALFLLSTLLFL